MPNAECRKKAESRSSNRTKSNPHRFRISVFGLLSDLGFRYSDLIIIGYRWMKYPRPLSIGRHAQYLQAPLQLLVTEKGNFHRALARRIAELDLGAVFFVHP